MSDLLSFLGALLGQWIVLMSGIVALVFTLVQRFRGAEPRNKIFWSVAAFCFFLAFFLAWREKHHSLLNTRQELSNTQQELLKEKDKNAPKLDGKIEQVIVSESPDAQGAQIFIYLSIRNAGGQSIAEKFILNMKSPKFQYQDIPVEFRKEAISSFDLKTWNVTSWDSIEKVAREPIVSGKVARGWLRFIVNDKDIKPENIRQPKTQLTISFKDFLGQSYSAAYEMYQPSVNP
jgi:hypothetical protein